MDAYKHGFVVKSQKELEELMGPPDSDGSWYNYEGEWADSFVSEMGEYLGKPFFEEATVVTDRSGRSSKVSAWGWNFDTRWVHELKRCTFKELVAPLDRVYAVCVPRDIFQRIWMRAGLIEDSIDLVSSDIAVALKNIVVPGNHFVCLRSEVGAVAFLGHLWMSNELDVLYIEKEIKNEN